MITLQNFIDPLAKLLGEWAYELNTYSIILRLLLALICGSIIGIERSSKRHSAGFRTFILVTLMGCLSSIIDSILILNGYTNLYLFASASTLGTVIISGNSILFSSKKQIKGLTTSAGLWLCEILGLVIGLGYYSIALALCLILIIILAVFPRVENILKDKSNHFEIHLELKEKSKLSDFLYTLRKLQLRVDDIELNSAYIGSGLSVYSISITDEKKQKRNHNDIINALSTIDYVYYIDEIK